MNRTKTNFTKPTREKLAMSANFRCVRPGCGLVTHFYDPTEDRTINIQGQGAHIHAASKGGARYDIDLTDLQVRHYNNGVWLCANCATLIDRLPADYPPDMLKQWQKDAVERIRRTGLGAPRHLLPDPRGDSRVVCKFLEKLTDVVLPGWRPGKWISWEAFEALKEIRLYGRLLGPGNNNLAIQHSIRNRQLNICALALNQVNAISGRHSGYDSITGYYNNYVTGYSPTTHRLRDEDEGRFFEIKRLHDELREYLKGPPMTLLDSDW